MPLYARLWVDILGDPKLRRAEDEGAKNLVILPWLLAWAKRADASGRIETAGKPSTPREIARDIPNVSARSVGNCLQELSSIGVLVQDTDSCYRFASWDYRNSGKTSDSKDAVAERVRRHRERKRQQQDRYSAPSSNAPGNGGNALHVTDVTSKRVESREEREESREKRVKRKSGVVRKGSLPPAALAFGRTFYGTAPLDRQREVKRQLRATLNGGAQIRRGVRVLAGSVERLEAKCREVIAEGVKDPDKAIVVLLKKLADVGNAEDSPTERAAAVERADDQFAAVRLAHANAWLELNPELATTIDRDIEARFAEEQAKLAQPISKPFADLTRRFYRNAAVLKAWTDAGEPVVEPAAGGTSP